MGTKLRPGQYDCYNNAEPDEPMFVLLARDPLAPLLVRMWADLKLAADGEQEVVSEAMDCAAQMDKWRERERPLKRLKIHRA